MRPLLPLMLTAAALVAYACTPTEVCGCSPLPPPSLETDRPGYVAEPAGGEGTYRQYAFTLIARFSNTTSEPIYLDRCFPADLQPIYGLPRANPAAGQKGSAYEPGWGCVGHDNPIKVSPREVRIDTLRITGPTSWQGSTGEILGVLEGEFRLVYVARWCVREGECPPLPEYGRSNVFQVTLGR